MKYDLNQRADLVQYLDRMPALPEALKAEILRWPEVAKSPFSHSFYSSKAKRWNVTPEGCRRISNHWNFRPKRRRCELHCVTDRPVANRTHWTLAIYRAGVWEVLQTLPRQLGKRLPARSGVQ